MNMKRFIRIRVFLWICGTLPNHVILAKVDSSKRHTRGSRLERRDLSHLAQDALRKGGKKTPYPTFLPTTTPSLFPTKNFFTSTDEVPTDISELIPTIDPALNIPFFGPSQPTSSPKQPPNVTPVGPPNEMPVGPPIEMPVGPPNGTPVGPPNETPVGPPNEMPVGPPNETPVGPPNEMPMGPPNGMPVGPPNGMPIGPPNETPVGPPNGMPVGPPNGMPVGPPNETPVGPPNGMPVGPPNGMPVGPPNGMPVGPPNETPVGPPNETPTEPPGGASNSGVTESPAPSMSPSMTPTVAPTVPHPSCLAAQNGTVFVTPDSMTVTYFYEVLTTRDRVLVDVAEAVDDSFQAFLAQSLVNCSQGSDSDVQGVSPGDPDTFVGGTCQGISFFNPDTDVCYVMVGSQEVFLSATSTMTSLEIQDLVWSTLRAEINESRRLANRRHLASSLIDVERGILALYFASADAEDNTDSASGGVLTAKNPDGSNGVGPAVSAALVGISVFVIAVLGFLFLHRRRDDEDTAFHPQTPVFDRAGVVTLEHEISPAAERTRPKVSPAVRRNMTFSPLAETVDSKPESDASPLSTYDYANSSTPPNEQTQTSYAWSNLGVSMVLATDGMLQSGVSESPASTISSLAEKYEKPMTMLSSSRSTAGRSLSVSSAGDHTPKTPSTRSLQQSGRKTPLSSNTRSSSEPSYTPGKSLATRDAMPSTSAHSRGSVASDRTDAAEIMRWTNDAQSSPEAEKSAHADSGTRVTNDAPSSPETEQSTTSSGSSRVFRIDYTGLVKPIPIRPSAEGASSKVGTAWSREAHKRGLSTDRSTGKENATPNASNLSSDSNYGKKGLSERTNDSNQLDYGAWKKGQSARVKSPLVLQPRTPYETNHPTSAKNALARAKPWDAYFTQANRNEKSVGASNAEVSRPRPLETRQSSVSGMITSSTTFPEAIREKQGSFRQALDRTRASNDDTTSIERMDGTSRRGRSRSRSRSTNGLATSENNPGRPKTPDSRKSFTQRRSRTPDTRRPSYNASGSVNYSSSSSIPARPRTPSSHYRTSPASRGTTPHGVSIAGTSMSSVSPAVLRYSEVPSGSLGAFESDTVQF